MAFGKRLGKPERGFRSLSNEVLIDSYPETNKDSYYQMEEVHPATTSGRISAVGQAFKTPMKKYKLTKAKFYLTKVSTPTGHLVARLYASTGTFGTNAKPTGDHLAESNPVDVTTLLLNPNYGLVEFPFSGDQQYLLNENTVYCIAVVVKDGEFVIEDDYVRVGRDFSSATHEGNVFFYLGLNGGDWSSYAIIDACFYVYGVPQ